MSPIRLELREWRRFRGMSQAALAKASHVSKATIVRIECEQTNGIDFGTLDRLCCALAVEPAQLFTRNLARPDR